MLHFIHHFLQYLKLRIALKWITVEQLFCYSIRWVVFTGIYFTIVWCSCSWRQTGKERRDQYGWWQQWASFVFMLVVKSAWSESLYVSMLDINVSYSTFKKNMYNPAVLMNLYLFFHYFNLIWFNHLKGVHLPL